MTDYKDLIDDLSDLCLHVRNNSELYEQVPPSLIREAREAIMSLVVSRDSWRGIAERKMANIQLLYWHSVKEELPEFERDVLAFCVNGEETRIAPCAYHPGSKTFYDCVFNCYAEGVTHWMGMPAPPMEETKDG